MLDTNKRILRVADPNEIVQLHLDGGAVAILRVLDQEHDQERDDGCAGIDDKLPSPKIDNGLFSGYEATY